jgi:hypothetical protein
MFLLDTQTSEHCWGLGKHSCVKMTSGLHVPPSADFCLFSENIYHVEFMYEGKSVSKLQMDIELKQIRILIRNILLFLNIISLYIQAVAHRFTSP